LLRLTFLAHAPTAAQRLLRFPADEGIEPVDPHVAQRLMARIGRCDAVWRGPERRAAETAEALGLAAPGLAATPCDDLRAWSVGAWSGQAVSEVAEHDPAGFHAWRTDPDATPGGGESLTALLARVARWAETQARGRGRALVIADPTVIRAAIVHALDAGPPTFWRLEIAPLSLSVVQYASGSWRLKSLVLPPPEGPSRV
jgi:broad specificity phosphatase PhoE